MVKHYLAEFSTQLGWRKGLIWVKSPYQNEKQVRCQRFGAAARREEGEYPLWIFDRRATPQQRQRSGNPPGCLLAGAWRRCSSVRERCGYLLRRALPAARQQTAHPFLILIWALSRSSQLSAEPFGDC